MPGPPGSPPTGGGGSLTRPPATTTYTPGPLAMGRPGVRLSTLRDERDPDVAGSPDKVAPLPNVRCLGLDMREFVPMAARFRYAFDRSTLTPSAAPRRLESVFPLTAKGRYIVAQDDRVRVVRRVGTRGTQIVFDGYKIADQGDLGGETEAAHFTAVGTPYREWDTPLAGAVWRDASGLSAAPDTTGDPDEPQDIATDLPTRFNPDGKGNCTPSGGETIRSAGSVNEQKYSVFADPLMTDPVFGVRPWSLVEAVKYCMAIGNPTQKYVLNGDLSRLDTMLVAIKPAKAGKPIDLTDDATFTREDIVVQDIDVTGEAWPDAVRHLIEPWGFGFCFDLSTNALGMPEWRVRFYRKDDASSPRSLYLQRPGSALVPGRSNLGTLSLTRDTAGVQNRWLVATEPVRYEASFVLDSLWQPDPADLATPSLYVKGVDGPPLFRPEAYRDFILDESGEGRWDRTTGALVTTPASLGDILQPAKPGGTGYVPRPDSGATPRTWVQRRRKPLGELASKDATGEPRDAELWISLDYGEPAGLWKPDGANLRGVAGPKGGTWQRVSRGAWERLDDRIGVRLTGSDPRAWSIGAPPVGGSPPLPGAVVNVPASLNGSLMIASDPAQVPGGATYRFALMLVCTIEGDHDIDAEAARRASSPTKYPITRYDDARDRFKKHVATRFSKIVTDAADDGPAAVDTATTDDTAAAQSQADGRRRANERGVFGGSATVPYFTDAYRPGDKVTGVVGRTISFAQNAAREAGEAPIYPPLVGVSWDFEGGQATSFSVADFRAEPAPEHDRRNKA